MANIYIGDLPLKTSIEDNDSLVSYIGGKASRISYKDLMSDVVHSDVSWSEITNKIFDGIDNSVLSIANDEGGGTLLTFSSDVVNTLSGLGTRLTTAEGDIDTIEGDITTLGTSVTNVSNTATATQTKVTALNSLYTTVTTLARTCGYNVLQTLDSNNNYLTFALNGKDGSPYNNEDLQSCLFTLSSLTIGSAPTYNSSNQRWSLSLNTSSAMSSGYTVGVIKGQIFDEEWTSGRNYTQGVVVVNNNQLYKCLTDNNDSTFDSTKWQQITSGGGGGGGSFSIVSGVFKHTDWRVIDNRQYAEAHNGQPNDFPYICKCCVMDVDSIVNPDNIMLVDQDNFDYNTPPPVLAQGIMMFDNDSQYANDEARGFYNRIIHTNADLRNMPAWSEDYDSDINPQSQRPFPWGDVWFDKGGWEGFTIYLDYREDTPAVDIPVALLVTN